MSRRMWTPSYHLHKPSGQAVVTLDGRDIYLGKHDTPESRREYDRLIAEWLANGRRLTPGAAGEPVPAGLTVNALLVPFLDHHEANPETRSENVLVPYWHPNQLRHLHGTEVRRRFGLEAAR
jgi:hypothetical protein